MYQLIKFLFLLIFLQAGFISYAQINTQPPSDTTREFEIIRGPSMRAIKIDSVTTLQTIAGGAVVKQGTTIFHSDSLVINPVTHVLEAFGNIEINQADTVHTYSQYLKYLGVEKIAYLKKKVKLSDKKGTLFTEDLDYNLENKNFPPRYQNFILRFYLTFELLFSSTSFWSSFSFIFITLSPRHH